MTDNSNSIIMRVPVSVRVGPVPADITSHAQKFTFALANFKKILADKGIAVELDGERALTSYIVDDVLKTFTHLQDQLEVRHYQIAPNGDDHSLQISVDEGKTFTEIAVFKDYDVADAFGRAWVDGRAEQPA